MKGQIKINSNLDKLQTAFVVLKSPLWISTLFLWDPLTLPFRFYSSWLPTMVLLAL